MHSPVSTASADQLIEELKRELKEDDRRDTATAEILRIISSSPTNVRAVLEMVAASAARLCNAHDAAIHQVDAGLLRLVAHYGPILTGPTMPMVRGALIGRAILERRGIQVADLPAERTEYPEGSDAARRLGFRATLAVPLIRADEAIGVIAIRRTEARPFSDKQITLLETFANQAVIAIENTRLFEAVQARTRQVTEALEYQTATSHVLGIISRSPTNAKPVFDAIAQSAARLCEAIDVMVLRVDGDLLRLVGHHGPLPAGNVRLHRGTLSARTVLERRPINVDDLQFEDQKFPEGSVLARTFGHRTCLSVPLLTEGVAIGNILVRRNEVRSFSERQISLLKTFADQAVIAIENARLFEEVQARSRELSEALDQQTSSAKVLSVISATPGEVSPVFDTILEEATRLCEAQFGVLHRFDGTSFIPLGVRGGLPELVDHFRSGVRPSVTNSLGRILHTKRPVN